MLKATIAAQIVARAIDTPLPAPLAVRAHARQHVVDAHAHHVRNKHRTPRPDHLLRALLSARSEVPQRDYLALYARVLSANP
jgi:hypothetical protein